MDGGLVTVTGQLMGVRVPTDPSLDSELVVRTTSQAEEFGPVADSMLLVAVHKNGAPRARYVSWIGYADLDEAAALEPGRWKLLEPATPYTAEARWKPYGWGSLEQVWTHPPPAERLLTLQQRNGPGALTTDEIRRTRIG